MATEIWPPHWFFYFRGSAAHRNRSTRSTVTHGGAGGVDLPRTNPGFYARDYAAFRASRSEIYGLHSVRKDTSGATSLARLADTERSR